MCGIVGFWEPRSHNDVSVLQERVQSMACAITHRGPDDSGEWVDDSCGVALGFRRLSIVDLTSTGHQPMRSAGERYIIIFNGEVYNFLELRTELAGLGHSFRGTSDTEVMLAAICQWGVNAAVKRFNGMFAFALWDRAERCLHLVRDRLGIKPLYYGWSGGVFFFGSELKALRAHPAFHADIDRDVLTLYIRLGYIPAPYSIFEGIFKLTQGNILSIPLKDGGRSLVTQPYWSIRQAAEQGLADPFQFSDAEAVAALDGLLRDGIEKRMIADVPLGAFLSGGIDSSCVVGIMQAISNRPVKTFSIGFQEPRYNEAPHAEQVARHLGTDHTELYVTSEEARMVIPSLPALYDEPFADSSQIPTFLVSEMARRYVTVSLSGDGGDELFAGYNRFFWANKIWKYAGWIPAPLRRALFSPLSRIEREHWGRMLKLVNPFIPGSVERLEIPDRAQKLMELLASDSAQAMFFRMISLWKHPEDVVLNGQEAAIAFTDRLQWADVPDFIHWMMYIYFQTYLPDDILVKVDRASMGVSLEARVPLLDDHRITEFSWRLPMKMKVRNGQSKWLLRQVLYQYVPRELIERPKMGFSVPVDAWLRGPLREWAEDYLAEDRLRREGFFNPMSIREKWNEHLSGKRNWRSQLWAVLVFQTWLESQRT